nr:hypothetical protein [Eubacterium sp.]
MSQIVKIRYILAGMGVVTALLLGSMDASAKAKTINYKKQFQERILIECVKEQGIDKNKDGKLSQKEIDAVTSFEVNSEEAIEHSSNIIVALDDLKIFRNLKTLKIHIRVSSLKPLYSLKKIRNLYIGDKVTYRKSLKFHKFPQLRELTVYRNRLDGILDLSKNKKLEKLTCIGCKLTSLNLKKNVRLKELNCSQNELEKLNISENVQLLKMDCSQNKIKKLNLSNNLKLKTLDCSMNNITELRFNKKGRIKEIICNFNEIKELDLSSATSLKSVSFLRDNNALYKLILPSRFIAYKVDDLCKVEIRN